MSTQYSRAPHRDPREFLQAAAPNAALLIDFDNVTMGMRSDLSKELKNLLNSDIIRGKVTVQRAYADWRRYPQYIVPLSEASIDLIFAPAYGASKKNATDIRMAIDGMELVFTRPEIGTYILLTGDSDFSSLVLKLKEYGKYVIGVGIQESSSDILVQNCDEYYSYTSLTGLRKTTETDQKPVDPWVLVETAVQRMEQKNDVMRSDRLKQVMLELDPGFDEGAFGYSKFSRFLTEAASRKLVHLKRLDNGQYEVAPVKAGEPAPRPRRREESRGRERGREETRPERGREPREDGEPSRSREQPREAPVEEAPAARKDPLQDAYHLLRRAVESLRGDGDEGVRDSDVKRKMLELEAGFDEAELGFSKFSRFLRQAHDHEVIDLQKVGSGNYEVSLRPAREKAPATTEAPGDGASRARGAGRGRRERPAEEATVAAEAEPTSPEAAEETDGAEPTAAADEPAARDKPAPGSREGLRTELVGAPSDRAASKGAADGVRLGLRMGSTRRRREGPPPLLEGQAVSAPGADAPAGASAPATEAADAPAAETGAPASGEGGTLAPSDLGLPTDAEAQVRYLTNSYRGVGKKTAEAVVEGFGEELFTVLQREPERVQEVLPAGRAEQLLGAWREDYERRKQRVEGEAAPVREGSGPRGQGGRGAARGSDDPGNTELDLAGSDAASQAGAKGSASRASGGRRTRRGGRRPPRGGGS